MAKRFENKKLNKIDHEKVDKDANAARKAAEGVGLLAVIGGVIKIVPWKKVGSLASKAAKTIFKA